ncbi:unnamed protein product, partial [Mesorhabditis spiculigera]
MKFEGILRTGHAWWKQGDEDDTWSKKAIDNLMKKLQKHNRESLASLDMALKNAGRLPSDCVTIPRSLDGRLQISHRKALPHVIYCRVYRWPDLQSHHELKAIESCRFCFESGQKEICINPYHYIRVEIAGVLPPVLVPRFTDPPPKENGPPPSLKKWQELDSTTQMPLNLDSNAIYRQQQMQQIPHKPDAMEIQYSLPAVLGTVPVPYPEAEHWATISYYELNTRVGPQVRVSANEVIIDGFTDPSTNGSKISLGLFQNVNRSPSIESTRRHIGNGVKLTYVRHQGTLFAECLSDAAVFIQSRNCNYNNSFHPTTVCKLVNKFSLKVFDTTNFRQLLVECAQRGFDASYDLTNMSIIRMSFVKGWGAEYQRQDVTSTPCWVEIHLHAPLQWLDQVLTHMPASPMPISSIS